MWVHNFTRFNVFNTKLGSVMLEWIQSHVSFVANFNGGREKVHFFYNLFQAGS